MKTLTKEDLLEQLAKLSEEDLRIALHAGESSRLEREEGQAYFLRYFYGEERHMEEGVSEIRMPIQPFMRNAFYSVHGGVLAYLADNCMASLSREKMGRPGVTLDLQIKYHNPGRGQYLIARGKLVHKAKLFTCMRAEIRSDDGTLVATATGTFYHRMPKEE